MMRNGPARPSPGAALWFEFSRPFTLVAPALGFASGAVTAAGAAPRELWSSDLITYPLIGLTMAAGTQRSVKRGIEHCGHRQTNHRIGNKFRAPGSRGVAPAAVTAPDAKPSAGATRVNGRQNSNQSPARFGLSFL